MRKQLFILGVACQLTLFAGWSPPINVYTVADHVPSFPAVGIDADGNAIVGYYVQYIMDSRAAATQLINGVPENPVDFAPADGTAGIGSLNIAVNASGNATLIWTEFFAATSSNYLRSTSFLGGMWSTPSALTDPEVDTVATPAPPGITMSSANNSIVDWVSTDTMSFLTSVNANSASSGTWGMMGTTLLMPTSDYVPDAVLAGTPEGHAFALWPNLGSFDLQGAYFNGTTWTPSVTITTDLTMNCGLPVSVSMNSSDSVLMLWVNDSQGALQSTLYNGMTYVDQTVYIPPMGIGVTDLAVVIGQDGNGACIWSVYDGTMLISTLYFASYSGGSWGTPIPIETLMGISTQQLYLDIGLDADGNAIFIWQRTNPDATTDIVASAMAKGATDVPPTTILSTDSPNGIEPDLAVNSAGQAVACWLAGDIVQAAILDDGGLTPPSDLRGSQVKNRFATQIDRVNVLKWNASPDPSVVKYYIFREGVKIGTVLSSSKLKYEDHNRNGQTLLYEVTAVNESDDQSDPISVYVP